MHLWLLIPIFVHNWRDFMKNYLLYICLLLHVVVVQAQDKDVSNHPKLLVGVVIDQMRWDYLYKYHHRYASDGFKKLMNEGINCHSAKINYIPSFTGPGHAAIYSGTVPSINGIVANDWVDVSNERLVYCVSDESVSSVGGSEKAGNMSPRSMYTTTITDELKLATQQRAKVYGVGLKDRGSILPAGHSADGAFWFDDSTGNFITSSYYMSQLPEWLNNFNNKRWADTVLNTEWNTLYPLSTYTNSTADNTPFEGVLKGEQEPVFPHNTPQVPGRGYNGIRYMPGGNTITLKAAKACIKGEQLGADEVTDFLCVTLSTTDYAGHNYGPDAVEMEDMYLRLDDEIASFLKYLDKQVGKGEYVIFLTADHGAAHNAGYMQSLRIPAGSNTQMDATRELNDYLKESTGNDSIVMALYNYQVYLNEAMIVQKGIDRGQVKQLINTWMNRQDGIAYVIDLEHMGDVMVPEPIKTMVINGYNKKRSGCMQVIMKPGWYSGHSNTGTTHGTWNPYDSHIPLLWYGASIGKGDVYRTINITDIAATLSALLHIQMPNGCIGNVIEEVVR